MNEEGGYGRTQGASHPFPIKMPSMIKMMVTKPTVLVSSGILACNSN